jgi:lysophospholipase L1-like esterase
MHRSLRLSIAILVGSIAPLLAQQPAPAPAPEAPAAEFKPIAANIDLKDGDSLVFLGDSITHQCLYTQYVEDYFYTRFPKKRVKFHNAGVGGDRASNALARFEDDVAAFQPKYVTILLGMNDGAYTRYEQPVFDAYQKDMTTVLERIAAIGATAVPMTPTMHDARAARIGKRVLEPRDTYYNGVLALYGAWLREQAQVRGLGFVDMYSPLNNLTLEQRKKDPQWTMIKDAVHPGATGQVVMAVAVINDMVPKAPVANITIQEKDGKAVANARGGKVTDLQAGENGAVSFTFAGNALPWVLPPEAAEGYELTKAGHRFSNEKLTVRTVKPGSYELRIDGQPVGKFAAAQLMGGVELQANDKTPQYQQALQVAMLNKKRNDEAMRPLRDQWGQLKGRKRELDKAEQAKAPDFDAKKAEFEKWYEGFKQKTAELVAKAKAMEDEIYTINQPKPHKYELVSVQ